MSVTVPFPSSQPPVRFAWLQLGFRPFFLLAAGFAVVGMGVWAALYSFALPVTLPVSPMTWHAHEMVFGYAMAVVAGFLLTAVQNWTGLPTLKGTALLSLVCVWVVARVLPFLPVPLWWMALADAVFMLGLSGAALIPIVRVKQWKQLAIGGKLLLLSVANGVFFVGALTDEYAVMQVGLYAGFYLILALMLTMGRRVIPFFIERGVEVAFKTRNPVWLDVVSVVSFLAFVLVELMLWVQPSPLLVPIGAGLAAVQLVLHSLRLWNWYHPMIWHKPLLWVLYLGYVWLIVGFGLVVLRVTHGVSPFLAIHAFAVGGVGLMTIGMMARVSLGHTGRNVFRPPASVWLMFALVVLSALVRVGLVGVFPAYSEVWVLAAQWLWIAGFSVFLWVYASMLIKPRVDGRLG